MDGARYGQAAITSAAFTAGVATVLVVHMMIDFSYLSRNFTNSIRRRLAETFHNFANRLSAPEYPGQEETWVNSLEYRNPDFEQDLKSGITEKTEESAVESMYQLPPWFLKNCVMTLEDLRASEIPLRVQDFANTEGKQDERLYEMDKAVFDELRTMIQQKPSSTTVQPSFNYDATILRTPLADDQSAEGFQYSVLQKLAVELGADILTLQRADIESLCEHFALHKAHLFGRDQALDLFFKIPNSASFDVYTPRRRRIIVEADDEIQSDDEGSDNWENVYNASHRTQLAFPFPLLLESPNLKRSTTHESSSGEDQEQKPLLIILSEVFSISASGAWGSILAQLRDAVAQVNSHSSSLGMMVVGLDSFILTGRFPLRERDLLGDNFPSRDLYGSPPSNTTPMLPLLGSKPLCVQPILPRRTKGQQLLLEKHEEVVRLRHNINMLQSAIQRYLGVETACGLLEPYAIWDTSQHGNALDDLKHSSLDLRSCEFVAGNIHGDPSIEKITKSLDRRSTLLKCLEEHSNSSNNSSHDLTEWSHLPQSAREAIKKIQSRPRDYEFENMLLDRLVNPGDVKFTWADIELEDDVKRAITQVVDLANADAHTQSGILRNSRINGALLYGPPGTGKTHLARVLAKEYGAVMIHVSAAEIESKWVGETEKIIKGLFNLGSMVAPSIIFIDEADSMLRKRQSDDGNYYRSRINTFLGQTDGLIHADRPPFLLLATNHPNELDEAVLRRVPGKLYIGMPTTTARNNMLAIFLREEKMEPEMRLSDIAAMTSGFTGSDIRSLCVQAALISQAESREKKEKDDKRVLRFVHFEEAMRRCAPTVSGDALDAIREFARKFDDSAMDKLGNSYNKEGLEKRKEKVKKAPRAIPDWVTSGDVGPGGNSTLSFDDWKNSDLYPYVTEELCQEWWQDSQEILE